MACSIVWTDRAVANLKSIEAYIAEDSPKQAKKVVNEIIDYVENLQVFPFMGSVVHELPEHDLRQLVKYSYRIIYSAEEDAVNVVTIIHGKQDFLQRFLRDSFSDVTP
jgi:addiction module RelE/StbE family toxin